jgi:hypothetical protein
MSAEGGGAARFNRRHDAQLLKAEMAGLGPTVGGPSGAEDIRNL